MEVSMITRTSQKAAECFDKILYYMCLFEAVSREIDKLLLKAKSGGLAGMSFGVDDNLTASSVTVTKTHRMHCCMSLSMCHTQCGTQAGR